MNLNIRPLEKSDEPAWRALWHDYLSFYESTVDSKVYDSTFARILSGNPGEFQGKIATVNGEAVGIVHYLFHRHCWRVEDVCYLQDLYTAPAARGQGVGRALIKAVYAAADAAGCPNVYWLTQDHNEAARKLYDQVGQLTPFIKYQRPQ
jgi:GNAT superfamily N-acetyltransferase